MFRLTLFIIFASALWWSGDAHAVNCERKLDHPQCTGDGGGGDGGGEDPPPADSNPAVVYTADVGRGRQDLYVMNADGSASSLLLQGSAAKGGKSWLTYQHGSWSPDGSQLLFIEGSADVRDLKIKPMDGSQGTGTTVFQGVPGVLEPWDTSAWRPQGDWIAFGVSEAYYVDGSNVGDFDLYAITPSGGEAVNLSDPLPALPPEQAGTLDFRPSWSPDGNSIAFIRWISPLNGGGFPSDSHQIIICGFEVENGTPSLNCPQENENGLLVPWREGVMLRTPAWHPLQSLIAYPDWGVNADGSSYDRADLLIESPDDTTCIHVRSAVSTRSFDGCEVLNIDAFEFFEVSWSCDGSDLLVTGRSEGADTALYLIADVLTEQGSATLSLLQSLRGASIREVASMRSCPDDPSS